MLADRSRKPIYEIGDIRIGRMFRLYSDRNFCQNYGKSTFQNLAIIARTSLNEIERVKQLNKHQLGDNGSTRCLTSRFCPN